MQSLTKEVVWDRRLLHELHHGQESRTPLLTDNDGVMKQSTKAINHYTLPDRTGLYSQQG